MFCVVFFLFFSLMNNLSWSGINVSSSSIVSSLFVFTLCIFSSPLRLFFSSSLCTRIYESSVTEYFLFFFLCSLFTRKDITCFIDLYNWEREVEREREKERPSLCLSHFHLVHRVPFTCFCQGVSVEHTCASHFVSNRPRIIWFAQLMHRCHL